MRSQNATEVGPLFAPLGAPRKGSHEDVIACRLKGASAAVAARLTGYKYRRVQQITATFKERVLPRILQLSRDEFPPSTIAVEVGLAEETVQLAIERFAEKHA